MDDNGAEMLNVRQHELDYEAHAAQLRQRLEQLILSFADIEAEADMLCPANDDDPQRLDELEARISNNIAELQPLSDQYDQLVAEWNQLDNDYGIMTSSSPLDTQHADKPTLPTKVTLLFNTFDGLITTINYLRQDRAAANADHRQSPNPRYTVQSPPSTVAVNPAHSVGTATPRANPAHSVGPLQVIPLPAGADPQPQQLSLWNPRHVLTMAFRHWPSFGFGTPFVDPRQ
ncbi:hypothetical protein AAVH_03135 [Aphelenchoides avenae]|nr:hypothetical protein AAVH_03135 [Aphelenchus avenae]